MTTALHETHEAAGFSGILSRTRVKRFVPGYDMPWHDHSVATICVLIAGDMVEDIEDRQHKLGAASVIYKPPGTMHRNLFGERGANVLTIEMGASRGEPGSESDVLPARPAVYHSRQVKCIAERVACELCREHRDAAGNLMIEALSLELVAEVARLSPPFSGTAPRWLESVRQRVEAEWLAGYTTRHYASEAGVHAVYLARTFRRHYGTSIGRYIRELRIDHAARELKSTTKSLTEVAIEAGFTDQAHFTHAFRRTMRMTPGAYRRSFLRSDGQSTS